ncbi:MAG: hypothetical protein HY000_28450 [Planctomycetes bacterium]|nr:hypothetical protein [Planctomycetota bacterium]
MLRCQNAEHDGVQGPGMRPRHLVDPQRRAGFTLIFFALLVTVLFGMLGLIIDSGLLMAWQRHTYNAADSAALAYAMDKLLGKSDATATTTALTFVQQHNGMAGATVVLNKPPANGPHAGEAFYVEAIVSYPVYTFFIQMLGINPNQMVSARAVATWGELRTAGEGAIVLDPRVQQAPGLGVAGGGTLRVQGGVFDNNEGGGVDENYQVVNSNNKWAATGGQPNSATGIFSDNIRIVGGVDDPAQFKNIDPNSTANVLHCGQLPLPDPLISLETPTTATGVDPTFWGHVAITNTSASVPDPSWIDPNTGAVTMLPGIYQSISITGGTVTMVPGIYVISAGKTNALKITGGTITAQGIMFYNTGANYDPFTGTPDTGDPYDPLGLQPPPGQANTTFGDVTLNAGMAFSPIDTTNPAFAPYYPAGIQVFDGMLFYQRRWNPLSVDIQGNSSAGILSGTIYGKWARFKISGQGTYDAQFIVGSMDITGTGDVTLHYAGQGRGKAPAVYLVE